MFSPFALTLVRWFAPMLIAVAVVVPVFMVDWSARRARVLRRRQLIREMLGGPQ